MINFDLSHIEEDEDSEYLSQEIAKLKAQNLTNNIDFEKAELEREELEEKLNTENCEEEKATSIEEKCEPSKKKDDEELTF